MEALVEKVKSKGINFNEGLITITPKMCKKIRFMDANRPINPLHVKGMKASVIRNGILRMVVVVYDSQHDLYYIVDGQHLFTALCEMNANIPCVIADVSTDAEVTQLMIDLNNTSKSWSLKDYINSWSASGKKDYKKLIEYQYTSDVQITVIMQAFTQKTRSVATKMVKEGNFSIVNEARGEQLIEYVSSCFNMLPNTRPVNEALIKLMLIAKDYDHKRMLKNLKKVYKNFQFSTKEGELYNQLIDIYSM